MNFFTLVSLSNSPSSVGRFIELTFFNGSTTSSYRIALSQIDCDACRRVFGYATVRIGNLMCVQEEDDSYRIAANDSFFYR